MGIFGWATLFALLAVNFSVSPALSYEEQDPIFYTTYSEIQLRLRKSLESQDFDFLLRPGQGLFVLEQQVDFEGKKWIRLGLEGENFVIEEGSQDLWILAEDFYKMDLVEETVFRMTYCYRYVKKYLLKKGFVDTYLPGASAYMAATILPKYGFSKSKRTPAQAKTYDVCVYKGGPSGHGHIEVRDPQGWYYGYGYKKQPIQNRTFLGCFYK